MEVLNKHFVNFDFDLNLLTQKTNFNFKNQNFFEFIYFLINKDSNNILCTNIKYEKSYLSFLASLGFVIPRLSNDFHDVNLWWGNFENIHIKKKLMSKYELTSILKNYNLIPEFVNTVKKGEAISASPEKKIFYRKEYGFSGLGNMIVDSNILAEENGTVAPLLEIVKAFGVTLNLEAEEYFLCENIVNEKGNFLGGRIIRNEIIANLLSIDIKEFDDEIINICHMFKKIGAVGTIQFDSLVFKSNSDNMWYKVVEVNYRKTMGLAIKSVTDILGPGMFLITKDKTSYGIELSPPVNKLKTYYVKD